MRKLLNQKVAASSKPQAKPYQIHDTAIPGLVLRIQPTGAKIWKLIQNRVPTTLGRMPVMTHAMAVAHATKILQGEVEDEEEATPSLTFDEYLKDYYQPHLEAHSSTAKEARQRLDRFKLGKKQLDAITHGDVERWRTKRSLEGRKASTLNRDVAQLRTALQKAVEWDLLTANPLTRLKPLRVDKQPVVRYLSPAEEKRLLAALVARDDQLRQARERGNAWRSARGQELLPAIGTYADNITPLTVLALNTGLRRAELWNLVWGDIDLRRKMLTVHGEGAKSGQTRHVPLNAAAVATLKAHRGDVSPLKSLPVFGRHEFKKAFAGILAAAKVENFRFHDCRHHFASKLAMAGVPLNTIRELLGHSDLKMTTRYAHLAPDNLRAAVELL